MDDLLYQSLNEIRIDVSNDSVDVQYSEPDQGGTLLLLRFRIPRQADRLPVLLSGYAHDGELSHSEEVEWRELPSRIARDLEPWLADQRRTAKTAGKVALDLFLADIQSSISASEQPGT